MKRLNEIPDGEIRIIGNLTLKRLGIMSAFLIIAIIMGIFLKSIFKIPFYILAVAIGMIASRESKENYQRNLLETYLLSFRRDKRKYYPQSEEEKLDKKGKPIKISRIANILPQIDIDKSYIETERGYMDIYEIEPCDVFKLNEEDRGKKIGAYDQFLKGFKYDFKIINTKSKNDFKKQIFELNYLLQKETNEIKRKALCNKISELKEKESQISKKAFYIVIYGDTIEELEIVRENFKNQFQETKICHLSEKDKIDLQRKLMSVGNYSRG